jgi:cellulose synthase/poly-beta-1,6-N-acetylglucosamine synthase-like glycosyltransferase
MTLETGSNFVAEIFRRWLAPHPLAGLLQGNVFELTIVVLYFVVLGVLAMYGLHRYWLVYWYFRYRRNVPGPPPAVERWPKVTIQLPLYNERYVAARLLEAVARLDYPRELLQVQVLDDSTDETGDIARACVERHRVFGLNIHYLHRAKREGYKAGALAAGLERCSGEFIAIFDADFVPPRDFLRRTLPCFANPQIGVVQARWTWLNRDYSLLTRVQAILLDGHFIIEHGARSRRGAFFNFNGTAGIWRRAAIEDAGGWRPDTLTEDTDLSYRAQLRGWRFLYLPDVVCPSELPVEMNALKAQQARWATGLLQTARKILPGVLRSRQPLHVKMEAFFHLTASICYPLLLALAVLLLPAMIVRFHHGWFQMLLLDLPLFLAATGSVSMFYLAAQREVDPKGWKRTFFYLPFVMAAGIGLAARNSIAVIEGLAGRNSEFVRTPKYRIESAARRGGFRRCAAYRPPAGWLPVFELAAGVYFFWVIAYVIRNLNPVLAPFLALFLFGYLYSGLLSLGQPWLERLRAGLRAPVEARPAPTGAPTF